MVRPWNRTLDGIAALTDGVENVGRGEIQKGQERKQAGHDKTNADRRIREQLAHGGVTPGAEDFAHAITDANVNNISLITRTELI